MSRNVIAIHFEDESRAGEALSELQAASAAGLVQLLQAAVVQRDTQRRPLSAVQSDVDARGRAPDR